jgi:hypothetical protein
MPTGTFKPQLNVTEVSASAEDTRFYWLANRKASLCSALSPILPRKAGADQKKYVQVAAEWPEFCSAYFLKPGYAHATAPPVPQPISEVPRR